MARNSEALKIFSGQLKVYRPPAPIPVRFQSVNVGAIKAGSETGPPQLITWLGVGMVKKNAMAPGLPQLSYSLVYQVSSEFDASALPDDYTLEISIRANSITGEAG